MPVKKKVVKKKTVTKKKAPAKKKIELKPVSKDIIKNNSKIKKVTKKNPQLQKFLDSRKISRKSLKPLSGRLIQFSDGIPTPFMNLNYVLTKNPLVAFEFARMTEMFGDEGCGKTTFWLQIAAFWQMLTGEPVGIVESEQRLNTNYALSLGLQPDPEISSLTQPDGGEQAFEELKDMVKAGYRLIINDSIAGNVPKAIREGKAGASHMGVHARLCGQQLATLKSLVFKHKCHIIFINQTRMKIGEMGDPTITTGGKEIKFWFSYRLRFYQPRSLKIESESTKKGGKKDLKDLEVGETETYDATKSEIGKGINIKIIKNNLNAPYQKVRERLFYGKGFDPVFGRLDLYKKIGLIGMSDTGKQITYGKKKDTKTGKMKDRTFNVPNFLANYETDEFKQKAKDIIVEKLQKNNPNDHIDWSDGWF